MDNARESADRLRGLLQREHGAMADFLIALAVFDRRQLWEPLGHASLFAFLHRELGLSKGASHFRKVAAELIQRFPDVAEPLRDGRLCITSVVEIAKVMTPENWAEVLPRFFHASKQEAKEVAAELRPQEAAPHRLVVTVPKADPAPRAPPAAVMRAPALLGPESESAAGSVVRAVLLDELPRASAPPAHPIPSGRSQVEPLTADLRRLHVTVSKRFMEKLAAARDALSHSQPGADAEAILEAGLDLLLERAAKRRGLVKLPLSPTLSPADAGERGESTTPSLDGERPPTYPSIAPPRDGERSAWAECCPSPAKRGRVGKGARHIPARVRREVWLRDGGRCTWPLAGGGTCGSTQTLQFDHVLPLARGGASTAANVRVLCQAHNLLAARLEFGHSWMDRYTRTSRDAGASEGSTGLDADQG